MIKSINGKVLNTKYSFAANDAFCVFYFCESGLVMSMAAPNCGTWWA